MIDLLSLIIAMLVPVIGGVWYLAVRLTRQDGWMKITNYRIGRIEKHLGLSVWEDSDDD